MLWNMSDEILDDSDFEIIDVTPKPKGKPRWGLWIGLAIVLVSIDLGFVQIKLEVFVFKIVLKYCLALKIRII